ncbi:MAG: LON peptidase substrate-binding domain-containing protein [Nitrospinae bacterium]|nr:LON peptidase substrate-binding domain-containing protein [Nitrospinota bacterium]
MILFPDQAGVPQTVPLFPLGEVVFFPFTDLQLHVFEPRYRAMVKAANEGEGHIAMAIFLPGWEPDYANAPAIRSVVTVGRLAKVRPEPDGRFYITLTGVTKARVVEEITDPAPYRRARIEPLPDGPLDAQREEAIAVAREVTQIVRKVATPATLARLRPPEEDEPTDRALIAFSYRMAHELKVDTDGRIALLETVSCLDRLARARTILSAVEAIMDAAPRGTGPFHGFSLN